jgi:4-hydroxythreonine-4-phosphate dehydrogenase
MKASKPILGLTMGDPAGIGPEVIAKSLPQIIRLCHPVVFGSQVIMDRALKRFQSCASLKQLTFIDPKPDLITQKFTPHPLTKATRKACGLSSITAIEAAVQMAQEGYIDGLVTAPICKTHIAAAGLPYPGHTEFIAALTSTKDVRMMMAGPILKVVLVTIHEPLALVPKLLSLAHIKKTIEMTHDGLKNFFGTSQPRLALAGLNPHAGEEGLFGSEEKKCLIPAVRWAQKKKIKIEGPLPPDTLFYRAAQGEFDAVISLYHDQGLIPFKLLHFKDGVNITLGLPIVRTSVDHGTAFDIAWKGKADHSNFVAAVKTAMQMIVQNKN